MGGRGGGGGVLSVSGPIRKVGWGGGGVGVGLRPTRGGGGGGGGDMLHASARSLLPFDVSRLIINNIIQKKSIIFNNVSTYGRGAPGAPPTDTPLIQCMERLRKYVVIMQTAN